MKELNDLVDMRIRGKSASKGGWGYDYEDEENDDPERLRNLVSDSKMYQVFQPQQYTSIEQLNAGVLGYIEDTYLSDLVNGINEVKSFKF